MRAPAGTDSPPNPTAETGEFLDQNGADDHGSRSDADDFSRRLRPAAGWSCSGLLALELDPYRDVALVYAPHPPDNGADIIRKIIDHCERQRFRFAVIDCDRDAEPSGLDPRGLDNWDTQLRGVLRALDPRLGSAEPARLSSVPPGGHVLGVYARTDTERGVFKAPANEVVRGALDVRFDDRRQHCRRR